jgi:uncharacterized lipoprotein YbaY
MKLLKLTLAITAFLSSPTLGSAQSNWLDMAGRALPKVNMGLPATTPSGYPTNAVDSLNSQAPNAYTPIAGYATAPMLVPNRKDWKLGVYVQNTEIGAQVTSVAPGSAGQQAGLEQNDIIVAVGTSRIGTIDNRIVELADEIRRNTDPYGRVTLLVYDSRQRALQSLSVSMNSSSNAIVGSVAIRDRVQLPYGSTMTVQLMNASRPYSEVLGGKTVVRADGTGPFSFELNCDPRYIDPRDQYQLYASISTGTQEAYRLMQPIAINPSAMGQPLNIVLDRTPYGMDNSSVPGGNVINAGYPSLDVNQMNQLFLQLLGRNPSNREVVAWQAYLQQGNSINDLKAKLLSSPQYRERFGNDSMYLQQVITSVNGRSPNAQELSYWMGRLQATGSPETVVSEMLTRTR